MEVKFPVKREKLTENIQLLVPPSTKELKKKAESELGLDFPTWARDLIRGELEKLLASA